MLTSYVMIQLLCFMWNVRTYFWLSLKPLKLNNSEHGIYECKRIFLILCETCIMNICHQQGHKEDKSNAKKIKAAMAALKVLSKAS